VSQRLALRGISAERLCQLAQRGRVSSRNDGGVARVNARYVSCNVATVLELIRECSIQRRLAARRLFVPSLAIIGAALAPGRAEACGGIRSPNYAITGVSPSSESSAVARDAGIIVSAVPSSPSPGPSVFAEVELIDADTEQPMPLRFITWYSLGGSEETLALHPSQPLEAQHSYRIEATPIDLAGDGSVGAAFVTTFMTSSALLEPLRLSGALGLSLRGEDVDITECGPCGYECAATGKRRALLMDVQLPAPSGGQGAYRGVLHFSDRTPMRVGPGDPAGYVSSVAEPHDVHVMQFVKMEAGETLTLTQEVFDESSAYEGCFTFVVWDPGGHVAQTSTCLPSLSADEMRALARDEAPLALSTDEDIAAEQVRQAAAGSGDEAQAVGCAFGVSQRTTTPAWLALLLGSVIVRSLSRRR
jgi:hypothetical protein